MFTEGEPEFCPEANKASKASFLGMFMQIDRRFMGKCFGQMQEFGIYPGQIPVLGLLAHRDGLSQKEIAERLRIKPPTVNVTVQRLEKAGFLYRKADEKDQHHFITLPSLSDRNGTRTKGTRFKRYYFRTFPPGKYSGSNPYA